MSLMLDKLIDPEVAVMLAKHKVMTVNDFLKLEVDKLSEISQLPAKDILHLKQQFVANHLTKPAKGDEYYEKQLKTSSILRTWIPGLDKLLDGGLRIGTLTEICGTSGSGKTQLALNVAVNLVGKYKICVLYVDTKGDFVPSHLASLIDKMGFKENANQILENIKVSRVTDFYSLISLLHYSQSVHKKTVKALIIDSIAALYFPFIGKNGEGNEGLSLVNHSASLLKKLASTNNLTVVLINLALSWNKEVDDEREVGVEEKSNVKVEQSKCRGEPLKTDVELKPALGKFWEHVPNTRLLLTNSHSSSASFSTISVVKSDYLPTVNQTNIKIKDDGTISLSS